MEPIRIADAGKGVIVPPEVFEQTLESLDWTWQQVSRGELPPPFESLEQFQLAIIGADALLWCTAFMHEPEDPDHLDPYSFFDYQIESLRHDGSTVHKCGAEVGKTREIVAWVLHRAYTTPNGSGLIAAPQQTHLDEIIEAMTDQFSWNDDLARDLVRHKKHPHHAFYFRNGFKVDFRPAGHDGEAFRGVHVRTFAIMDEAAKCKNPKQFSEFWRAMKPTAVGRIYSVPDGDRSCEFYKLGQRAAGNKEDDNDQGVAKHLNFRLFKWAKTLMPPPYWTDERRKFYVEQYGGEDSPGYQHNVLGEDGDPENTVFPWHHLKHCIRQIDAYRCLKILVDSSHGEVIVTGYRCEMGMAHGEPHAIPVSLIDTYYPQATFFDADDSGQSDFTRLLRSFFVAVPGLKRGGGDLGFSGDPTEIIVKNIIGKQERWVARLQLKHVTYDQQCQALNAMDDVYGPMESLKWGTDFGNAGSAVAHDLQGLAIYDAKEYEHRLRGFQFESTTDNVSEDGAPLIDNKTGKPSRITLKELATDLLVKKMQRQQLEIPPDPDIIHYYTNHTVRMGQKHRIFRKDDDHLIDADRAQILAHIMAETVEDIFA
ncbi:MAG: hypothetical protein OEV73_00175 [Desulfobulbaceae bacterium]|nr:hypothetical protein [Desulfobulbaceae bacterium]